MKDVVHVIKLNILYRKIQGTDLDLLLHAVIPWKLQLMAVLKG